VGWLGTNSPNNPTFPATSIFLFTPPPYLRPHAPFFSPIAPPHICFILSIVSVFYFLFSLSSPHPGDFSSAPHPGNLCLTLTLNIVLAMSHGSFSRYIQSFFCFFSLLFCFSIPSSDAPGVFFFPLAPCSRAVILTNLSPFPSPDSPLVPPLFFGIFKISCLRSRISGYASLFSRITAWEISPSILLFGIPPY